MRPGPALLTQPILDTATPGTVLIGIEGGYSPNQECHWTVSCDRGAATIDFESLHTETGFDHIYAFDGSDTEGIEIGLPRSGTTVSPTKTLTTIILMPLGCVSARCAVLAGTARAHLDVAVDARGLHRGRGAAGGWLRRRGGMHTHLQVLR